MKIDSQNCLFLKIRNGRIDFTENSMHIKVDSYVNLT